MTEAIRTITEWALSQPSIFRVWAVCDVENAASVKVLEKAGFQQEGIFRRWLIHPDISDEPRDCYCYAAVKGRTSNDSEPDLLMTDTIHTRLVEEVKIRFIADPNVRAIFSSGSVARGETGRFSDIDIVLIVKEKRPYVRYHSGDLEIEVDSCTLEEIPARLQKKPMTYYSFAEVRALHDPDGLAAQISEEAERFRAVYIATSQLKGDLFVRLTHYRMKIASALDERYPRKAAFFAEIAVWNMVEALYTVHDVISPPPTHAYRMLLTLTKQPPGFPALVDRLLTGGPEARAEAALELLDWLIPLLRSAMSEFPLHYRPW